MHEAAPRQRRRSAERTKVSAATNPPAEIQSKSKQDDVLVLCFRSERGCGGMEQWGWAAEGEWRGAFRAPSANTDPYSCFLKCGRQFVFQSAFIKNISLWDRESVFGNLLVALCYYKVFKHISNLLHVLWLQDWTSLPCPEIRLSTQRHRHESSHLEAVQVGRLVAIPSSRS